MQVLSASSSRAYTHKIHRPFGGIAGYREIGDRFSRVSVAAFPMAMAKEVAASKAATAAAYILADRETAYIGETGRFGRRILEHAADPDKIWVREVYMISGLAGDPDDGFDKETAVFLQHRLTGIAEEADLVEVIKGVSPQVPALSGEDSALFERYLDDAERLLFDAGCRVLRSNFASRCRPSPGFARAEPVLEADDIGSMEIGVLAAPPPDGELELNYVDLWARGYPAQNGGFVVMAGSELRTVVNASAQKAVHRRRADLMRNKALAEIPGITDRIRLRVAVRFDSAAIAAKVTTGAHIHSGVWVRPRYPRPILIAA